MWYSVLIFLTLFLVTGTCSDARFLSRGGRRPPTLVPVVYAIVSTALPTTESIYGSPSFLDNLHIFCTICYSSAKYSLFGLGFIVRPNVRVVNFHRRSDGGL